jgi:hypothetical protein
MMFDHRLDTATTKELTNITRLVPLDRHRSAIRWQFIRGVAIGILVSSAVAIPAFKYSNIRQRGAFSQEEGSGQTVLGNSDTQVASRPKPPVPVPVNRPAPLTGLAVPELRPTKKTLTTLAQLWASAEAGNTKAAVALADLYLRGDGVPMNCDQARVLLFVASRENDAEATKKLQDLDETGCPAR